MRHLSRFFLLPLLLTIIVGISIPIAFCDEEEQVQGLFHNDHLNDASDEFPNDYKPLIIPVDGGIQITVAPFITCTSLESGVHIPLSKPCKLAQTILVDDDWSDGNISYTYAFEDWIDFDWDDIIVDLYASKSNGIFSALLLSFREARWKNPFGLEISVDGTWVKVEWNSTDFLDVHSLIVDDGETVELDLLIESNTSDRAFIKFMIPPVASFSWKPELPNMGETVTFNASASYDVDMEIETYSWVFGDGTSLNTSNPVVTHVFAHSRTYTITLTVTDSDGLTDNVTHAIYVQAVIGGETTTIDSTLSIIWRNSTMLLIVVFGTVAAIAHGKRKLEFF